MAGQFVKNGATLKCPLCSSSGTLVVSHTQVQLQDTPCATNGDKSKSNLVFGGVCKKWRKSPPPCASVIAPTQWKGVATDVEIDGEFMLLEDSTITCSTGGVDIGIEDTAQMDVPTDLPDTENAVLKKFLVNVRRPDDYKGEYGFDWLRDEYIYPIETIAYDNLGLDGTLQSAPLINQQLPVCKNPEDLKNEYKTKDVVNPITPYGAAYYPAWLSIFPNTSYSGVNEVQLNIEVEEIEPLVSDATEIIFESANDSLIITPAQIPLNELLGKKQSKNLGTSSKEFYTTEKIITVKCEGSGLENHEEIKIYAELNGEKEEVGKLMVYKNSEIPNAEIVIVKATYQEQLVLNPTYQNAIKYQSLNQALINTEISVIVEDFRIEDLPEEDEHVEYFISKFITPSPQEVWGNNPAYGGVYQNEEIYVDKVREFKDYLIYLYEKYGENGPSTYYLSATGHYKTYLFYTPIAPVFTMKPLVQFRGIACAHENENSNTIEWGNAVIVFGGDLLNNFVTVHELGHSFSLPHSFEERMSSPFIFYRGFTDNYMDYDNLTQPDITKTQVESKFEGNMHSFFKWQWDIMRGDKSLVYNNTDIE
ncbi:DUF4280 domain-containing protein [uncultured Aquimarina sp.]|uniref:DUF4280 domain-containing protein n=1 Tax=uncultured Aquimarina sp. TaxID=575652 RepID=UPI002623181E|nr:DUF4280 domain-containing protein [uncultured Aquimarina sp.]